MSTPAFLYGIGAAKAGTTWLARALRQHPECAMPPVKETHYFDSLEQGSSVWVLDQMIRIRADARKRLDLASDARAQKRASGRVQELDRWIALIAARRQDDATYQWLMRRQLNHGARVVADVTPAYALLSEDTLRRMARLNGGATRFLMILRDPVDRLWSNISMSLEKRMARGGDAQVIRRNMLDSSLNENTPEIERSDYVRTLSRLEKAVPEAQRLCLFFEDLFRPDTLGRIRRFLGLTKPLMPIKEKVNAGMGLKLEDWERDALASRLAAQYEYVLKHFGEVPERWQTNMNYTAT